MANRNGLTPPTNPPQQFSHQGRTYQRDGQRCGHGGPRYTSTDGHQVTRCACVRR
jgi:hypothetical protein